jgi:transcriptional regulator with XRE-family HTH domain
VATSPPRIGTRIKRARERKRLTQAQLGEAVGVSQKTIDNWENDRTYPKSSIGALEEFLGIDLGTEDQRPRIPSRILEAVNSQIADPAERQEMLRAIEEVLTRRADGGPEVTLHGALHTEPCLPAGPARAGAPLPVPI